MSQAEAVRDLLVERLELYDSTLDTSEGSPLWAQVIAPVFARLGTDPFDTDIRSFLKDRLAQEFPAMAVEEGDSIVDLLVTPLEVLLEPLKREIQTVRMGQSVRNADTMRLEDAKGLAGNWWTYHRSGTRASTLVRIYYAAPTHVNVLATTTFTTGNGLRFIPTTPILVRPETMLLQRSGTEYYIEVPVVAEEPGVQYGVAKGAITGVEGLSGYTRVTNLSDAAPGRDAETGTELLRRTEGSLTERSLNVRKGIVARLRTDFATIVDVEAVGFGDPEMERDILTGGGQGTPIASGTCIIIGQFVLMFSMFENRGETGQQQISVGDEIELNFWNFLYEETPNESFLIDTILFDSRNAITEIPSVVLFQIDGVPSVTAPVAGTLPGVLPGVFAIVKTTAKVEVSDIPGGILNPDTARGTIEVKDGEVHLGGHYDVWLRPAASSKATADMKDIRSESALIEGDDLVVNGQSGANTHLVHRAYKLAVNLASGAIQLGEKVTGGTSGAVAWVSHITSTGVSSRILELWEMSGTEFEVSETITGATSGGTATITGVDSYDWGVDGLVEAGMLLAIVKGTEEGVYRALKVEGPFLYLDVALTTTGRAVVFRVLDEVQVNMFDPKAVLIPFGDATGEDLRTTIGAATLRTTVNLQTYGVQAGDTLEILTGDDKGVYTIRKFDEDLGGVAPVVGVQMTATNSSVGYQVYRTTSPLQRPLVRIQPGGVTLLDPSGQDSGYTVPPALPVDARSLGAFSGSKPVAVGANGFVLMDPGSTWAPTADYATDIDSYDWSTWTGETFQEFYEEGGFKRCFTDECITCEGYIAVVSVYDNGDMYLDSSLPAAVQTFLQSMKSWFLGVIASFNFGGDETELVNGFSPIKFGPNEDTALTLLLQFEVCLPFSFFDGCNNVFVALPEFDWESEFAEADTFEDAVGKYNDGAMLGPKPGLSSAQAGDVLTVLNGANAGSYVVDDSRLYYLVTSGAIVEGVVSLGAAYQVAVVTIRDEFPVPPLQGLAEFFAEGNPTWSVPSSPDLPFEVVGASGAVVAGWDWIETALTWFFQWMDSLGFDLPEKVELDVPETMKAFWQLLFSDYIVSRPTCAQTVRMHFVEPTSCTVYAPQACARYQWALPAHSEAAITGSNVTLPMADLEGLSVALTVLRLDGETDLAGTLPAAAGTAATVEALAEVVQAALDADAKYITVSGPATATGALTITQVGGGTDFWIYATAEDRDDAFFWLGFFESDPGDWAGDGSTGPFTSFLDATQIVLPVGWGFQLRLPTTLVLITATDSSGALEAGETVTGSISGATGTVWATMQDSDDIFHGSSLILMDGGSADFQSAENMQGGTTAAVTEIGTVQADFEFDINVYLNNGTYTYEELATQIEVDILEWMVSALTGASPGSFDVQDFVDSFTIRVVYEDDIGDETGNWRFVFTLEDATYPTALEEFTLDAPNFSANDFVDEYMGGGPIASTAGVATGWNHVPPYDIGQIIVDVTDAAAATYAIETAFTYDEALELEALRLASDIEGVAQYLNARDDSTRPDPGDDRVLQWVGVGGTSIEVRALFGGPDASAAWASNAAGMLALGFSAGTYPGGQPATNATANGSTAVGTSETVYHGAHEPTLFVAAAGAAEVLFVPADEADPFQVFPGMDDDGDVPVSELPRDLRVGTPYDGQLSTELAFTDASYASPIELGFQEGADWVWLYEHLTLLELAALETDGQVTRDRVVAAFTEFGSSVLTIPAFTPDDFTFLAPSVTAAELSDHRVEVGDILFIEEGEDAQGYTVVARTAHSVTVDRQLTESSGRVYGYGNDGVIDPDLSDALFRSTNYIFTEDDIGRWVTLWACNYDGFDGSYKITAVDTDTNTVTLDTDVWTDAETDIHFAVVKAPLEDPGASATGGRTALVGLRPLRIYRGTATKWRIARVTPGLTRADARVYVSLDGATTGPRKGVKQPYKVVRPGAQRISSTRMAEQVDCGFYYHDVLVHSLGGGELFNVPKDTKMEPVFGTYDSDGYRIEVKDSRLTFSTSEEATLVLTPTFLPAGFDDLPFNLLKLEGRTWRVAYDYAPTVAQIQRMMTSETDRVLCANVLARHFLPSYVTFCLTYQGGNKPAKVAADLVAYIDGLPAVEELDVSKLERMLHANVVTSYPHPVYVWTLTHDLDRRMVAVRSEDRISDDNIPYHGTNRTTFFISGKDQSAVEEGDIPFGERVFLVRTVSAATVR